MLFALKIKIIIKKWKHNWYKLFFLKLKPSVQTTAFLERCMRLSTAQCFFSNKKWLGNLSMVFAPPWDLSKEFDVCWYFNEVINGQKLSDKSFFFSENIEMFMLCGLFQIPFPYVPYWSASPPPLTVPGFSINCVQNPCKNTCVSILFQGCVLRRFPELHGSCWWGRYLLCLYGWGGNKYKCYSILWSV